MNKPRLLDLFCGGGGAGMGYHLAGFDVVGVDIRPQPHYLFEFHQADAIEFLVEHNHEFEAIHASPPCQRYSSITKTARTHEIHANLLPVIRAYLQTTARPYVIENVPGARQHMRNPIMLCGTMFGLYIQRHRYFETSFELVFPPATCKHDLKVAKHGRPAQHYREFAAVTGHFSDIKYAREAMGIDWMNQHELSQAIPPAYTEFVGKKLMQHLKAVR